MNLEHFIHSEVIQKEKDEYHILMHINGIQKNGTEEFTYSATMEIQTQRIDLWTWGGGGKEEMHGKSNMEICITIQINKQWELAVWFRKVKQGLCINLEE